MSDRHSQEKPASVYGQAALRLSDCVRPPMRAESESFHLEPRVLYTV